LILLWLISGKTTFYDFINFDSINRLTAMSKVQEIYNALYDFFGPQQWWPGETPFEVMVGAVLTQNTNWENVTKAIDNLKEDNLLSLEALSALSVEELAEKIRPSGYFNLKAGRLKNLLDHINNNFDGSLELFFSQDAESLRHELLSVKGIGPETADSILLYAAEKPVFVVDAYTHRILFRHGLIAEEDDYHAIQEFFIDSLPQDIRMFNEYHALLVRAGKEFCKKSKPVCAGCPLADME
jgi:endonuclease-3 related protein